MPVKQVQISNFRAFLPTEEWLPESGEFSPGVNLLVGPNGSGKTSFMNALKLLFGRAAENSQTSMGDADAYPNDPKLDRNNEAQLWRIAGRLEYAQYEDNGPLKPYLSFPGFTGEVSFGEESKGGSLDRSILRAGGKIETITVEWKAQNIPVWNGLYNRGFAMGWPRRITALNQEAFRVPKEPQNAFKSPENQTHTHYAHNWKLITADTRAFLGISLPDQPEPPSGDGYQCPSCTQPVPKGRLGIGLPDQNGKPIYQGSDGIAHFLFMIMEFRKHAWPTTFIIEEPDVYLHPTLQKVFMRYVRKLAADATHQFFITTHSPYLIDSAQHLDTADDAHLYRVEYASPKPLQRVEATRERWEVLQRLGHTPADVLQANVIIWVEGPSDATYITTWLEAFIRQEHATVLIPSQDYSFALFGGATLKHAQAHFADELEKGHQQAFVELLTINPNSAIIIDSDHKHPLKLKWFTKVKQRIKGEFEKVNRPCWILQGNTIEDYVPSEFQARWDELKKRDQHSKPKRAQQYSKLTAGKELKDIVTNYPEVHSKISILHRRIAEWSGKA